MSITESKIHANLNRDRLFNEAWWLNYCFCCGRAVGDVGNPYIGSEARNLCLHSTCEMTSIGDPFCAQLNTMCCITGQCQFPPMDGSPTCVCCNKTLAAGKSDVGNWKPVLFDYTAEFKDTFWCVYFCCGGTGFSGISANGRPLYASMQKEFCVKQAVKLAAPVQDGVFCSGVGSTLCCWTQMEFPPAKGNPGFKCCGFPKKAGSENVKPMGYGKPGQIEMS